MKKITFILAATVLLFAVACSNSKKEKTNDEVITATINNRKGEKIDITYNTAEETATIVFNYETIVLKQQPSASGIRYTSDSYEYTEWQDEIELKKNGEVVFSNKGEYAEATFNFVDADGKVLTVIYDTSGDIPTATINYEGFENQVLAQVPESAWAKGAEYENESMKWVTNENGGDLTVNGKTISFKAQQ